MGDSGTDFLPDLERVVFDYKLYSHPGPSKCIIPKFEKFLSYEKILLSNAQGKRMSTVVKNTFSLVHFTAAFIFELSSPLPCDY